MISAISAYSLFFKIRSDTVWLSHCIRFCSNLSMKLVTDKLQLKIIEKYEVVITKLCFRTILFMAAIRYRAIYKVVYY